MEYGYKPTTHGRAILATCMATEQPLRLTRVAVGSGMVPDGVDLADVHELYNPVADGEIGERWHDDDRLHLAIQYSNINHPEVPTFYLSEFIVYAMNPETEEETDLLYATLGDYRQPVPAYNPAYPASLFNFPLVLILSDEIEVTIDTAPGLITYKDLDKAVGDAVTDATKDIGGITKTLLFTVEAATWQDGREGAYPYFADIVDDQITASVVPSVILDEESLDAAASMRMCNTARSFAGRVRLRAKRLPATSISGTLYLIGKATGSGGGGGEYELPPATESTLGGVIIGPGVKVDANGKVSVDTTDLAESVAPKVIEEAAAPDKDVDDMLDEVFGEEEPETP